MVIIYNRSQPIIMWLILWLPVPWLAALLAQVYQPRMNVLDLVASLNHALTNPIQLSWTDQTPRFMLLFSIIYLFGIGIGYDAGGTNGDAIYALNHYLGSPYVPTDTGVLSTSSIQTVINNIDPAYMQCRKKTGFWPWQFSYHAVALTGYNYSSGYVIQLMDPAYECFKASTRASDGSWSFAFGDTSFTWYRTVRLLYSV